MRFLFVFITCFLLSLGASSQNYQAMHGSDYAGSLAVGYNPASILSSPLSWDLALFGFQTKNYSNLYYLSLIHI